MKQYNEVEKIYYEENMESEGLNWLTISLLVLFGLPAMALAGYSWWLLFLALIRTFV